MRTNKFSSFAVRNVLDYEPILYSTSLADIVENKMFIANKYNRGKNTDGNYDGYIDELKACNSEDRRFKKILDSMLKKGYINEPFKVRRVTINGEEKFELLDGHNRYNVLKYLYENGVDGLVIYYNIVIPKTEEDWNNSLYTINNCTATAWTCADKLAFEIRKGNKNAIALNSIYDNVINRVDEGNKKSIERDKIAKIRNIDLSTFIHIAYDDESKTKSNRNDYNEFKADTKEVANACADFLIAINKVNDNLTASSIEKIMVSFARIYREYAMKNPYHDMKFFTKQVIQKIISFKDKKLVNQKQKQYHAEFTESTGHLDYLVRTTPNKSVA